MDAAVKPPQNPGSRSEPGAVRVWDVPTRLFHWVLVALVAVNLYTGFVGGLTEMDLHMKTGLAILGLVVFRVAWGFLGSPRSRFRDFVRGPLTVLSYARKLFGKSHEPWAGHNPLGGWSVIALLTILAVQAGTGLFSNDDIFTEGPLAKLVSNSTSDTLTAVHHFTVDILIALIVLHLASVTFYLLVKGQNLIRPMLTGRKRAGEAPPGSDTPFAPRWQAVIILIGAAGAVRAILSL